MAPGLDSAGMRDLVTHVLSIDAAGRYKTDPQAYALGTAARMGPGYFPRILGLLLIALGLALALRALRLDGSPIPRFVWRPLLVVLGSVLAFGLMVNHVGVVVSTIFLIVAASAASHEFRLRESLISGVALAALAVGVFVIGLKLQLPIWPPMFTS